MHADTASTASPAEFELRFPSLFGDVSGYSFPCDSAGRVALQLLSDRALADYVYARSTIGREYGFPRLQRRSIN